MVRAASGGAGAKAPGQRQLRVGEALRHALSEVLARRELRDPALAEVAVTVSEVRVSRDLQQAMVFICPLGGERFDQVLAGLRRAAPYLSARAAEMVRLKTTPRFRFEADRSFEQAERIERLLRAPAVARDLDRTGEPDGDP